MISKLQGPFQFYHHNRNRIYKVQGVCSFKVDALTSNFPAFCDLKCFMQGIFLVTCINHLKVALEVWEWRHYIALWDCFGGRFLCSRSPKQPHDAMVNGNFKVANMEKTYGNKLCNRLMVFG